MSTRGGHRAALRCCYSVSPGEKHTYKTRADVRLSYALLFNCLGGGLGCILDPHPQEQNITPGEGGKDENEERGREREKGKKSIQETVSELSYDSLVRVLFFAFSVFFLQGTFHPLRLV